MTATLSTSMPTEPAGQSGKEARGSPGPLHPTARVGRQEVLRPRRRHRLGRPDPGGPLRSVTGVVDAVRHAVGTARHGHDIHEYCSIGVGIWFEAAALAKDIYGEARQPHVQWACRDRRRVPALGDVRPDGGEFGPVLPAGVDPRQLRGADGRPPTRDPVAEEILDIFQRDLMKDERVQPLPGHQPDPRRGGGPAHAVRPRGDRPRSRSCAAVRRRHAPSRRCGRRQLHARASGLAAGPSTGRAGSRRGRSRRPRPG